MFRHCSPSSILFLRNQIEVFVDILWVWFTGVWGGKWTKTYEGMQMCPFAQLCRKGEQDRLKMVEAWNCRHDSVWSKQNRIAYSGAEWENQVVRPFLTYGRHKEATDFDKL